MGLKALVVRGLLTFRVDTKSVTCENVNQYHSDVVSIFTHTQLYSPSKAATIKKQTKQRKRSEINHCKISQTTGQHISILGLIFSTQSTNDIIGYGELAQKIRFSITYAHRRQRKIKHFRAMRCLL